MNKQLLAHVALFAVAIIYGVNYLVAKGLMPDLIGPSGFIFIRVTAAGLLFWGIYAFQRERVAPSDIPRLMICGLTGIAVNQLLFFNGLNATSPVNASIIMTSNPILVLIASAVILKTKITYRKIGGIALGASGAIALLLLSAQSSLVHVSWQGDLMIFLNAMSYGIYLVLVKPLMAKYKPMTVIAWVFLFGWLIVAPIGWNQFTEIKWSLFDGKHIGGVIYVVLGTTFLAYLLNVFALRIVQPTVVSVYIYLQPLLAGIFAFVFAAFGADDYTGDINGLRLLCALAIFIGVYLVSFSGRWRRTPSV